MFKTYLNKSIRILRPQLYLIVGMLLIQISFLVFSWLMGVDSDEWLSFYSSNGTESYYAYGEFFILFSISILTAIALLGTSFIHFGVGAFFISARLFYQAGRVLSVYQADNRDWKLLALGLTPNLIFETAWLLLIACLSYRIGIMSINVFLLKKENKEALSLAEKDVLFLCPWILMFILLSSITAAVFTIPLRLSLGP